MWGQQRLLAACRLLHGFTSRLTHSTLNRIGAGAVRPKQSVDGRPASPVGRPDWPAPPALLGRRKQPWHSRRAALRCAMLRRHVFCAVLCLAGSAPLREPACLQLLPAAPTCASPAHPPASGTLPERWGIDGSFPALKTLDLNNTGEWQRWCWEPSGSTGWCWAPVLLAGQPPSSRTCGVPTAAARECSCP